MKVSIADTDLEPLWDKLGPSDLDKDVVREEREAEDQIQRPGLGISGSSYMASESSNTSINNHGYKMDSPFSPSTTMKPNDNLGSTVDSNFTTSSSFIQPEEEVDERSHLSAGNATIHADQRRCEQVGEGTQIGEFAIVGDHIDKRGLEEWRRILIGQQFLFVPGEEEERRAFTPKNNSIVMPKNLRYLEYDVTVEKDCDEERLNICLDEDLEAWRVWFG